MMDTLQWNWLLSKKFRNLQITSSKRFKITSSRITNAGKTLLLKLGVLSVNSSIPGRFCLPRQWGNKSGGSPLLVASIPTTSKEYEVNFWGSLSHISKTWGILGIRLDACSNLEAWQVFNIGWHCSFKITRALQCYIDAARCPIFKLWQLTWTRDLGETGRHQNHGLSKGKLGLQ